MKSIAYAFGAIMFSATTAFSATSAECDRMTAHPSDHMAKSPAASYDSIDAERAIRTCLAALERDPSNSRFMVNLSRAYVKNESYEESLKWARRSAALGYPFAFAYLATHYNQGLGVEKDLEKGFRHSLVAANMGNPAALNSVGYSYLKGEGVEKNIELATKFFIAGMHRGVAWAFHNMGIIRRDGEDGFSSDYYALKLFHQAKDRGANNHKVYDETRRNLKQFYIDNGVFSLNEELSSLDIDENKKLEEAIKLEESEVTDISDITIGGSSLDLNYINRRKRLVVAEYNTANKVTLNMLPENIFWLKTFAFGCGLYDGEIDANWDQEFRKQVLKNSREKLDFPISIEESGDPSQVLSSRFILDLC